MATFILNDLVHNASMHRGLLDMYDFYILPMMNPDGYRHSCGWNRFWRKSRRSYNFLAGLLSTKISLRFLEISFNFVGINSHALL